jgi:hypothetical protein
LVLRTLSEVQQFNDIYGSLQRYAFIRWKDVAQDYEGIELGVLDSLDNTKQRIQTTLLLASQRKTVQEFQIGRQLTIDSFFG